MRSLTKARKREWLVFSLIASALFAFLVAMTLLFFLREGGRRRVELEYRAWRLSTLVMESLYSGAAMEDLPEGLMSFGLYDGAGRALQRSGMAPVSVSLAEEDGERISVTGSKVRVLRRIAFGGMSRMRGLLRSFGDPPAPPLLGDGGRVPPPRLEAPLGMMGQGRILLLELGADAFRRAEFLYAAIGIVFLGILTGAWFLVLRLYRRVLAYAESAERDRELLQLGEAARTIAHEIKNPLGTMRLQCATLRKTLPPERHANIDIVEGETLRLSALADRIGDFLRNPRGEPEDIDLGPWLASWASKHGLGMDSTPSFHGRVSFDPARLESVLGNLLSNALEASLEGAEAPSLNLTLSGGRAVAELADRGTGIDPAVLDRIWDPFFTSKAKGSGIGLALAKRFVQEAGGSISCRAREGGGMVFRIELPLIK